MKLKKKNVLITSGPTWVPIDKIRFISNIATGKTGMLIAKEAKRFGADVTVLMGPTQNIINNHSIKTKSFRYFNDFKDLFTKEINRSPDVVIHSAAVSDYQPRAYFPRKIKSYLKKLSLNLILTPKLADRVKKVNPKSFFVIFKLEEGVSKKTLVERAFKLLKHTKADLVVANTLKDNYYKAYLIDKDKKIIGFVNSKEKLAKLLIRNIREKL
ncbi:MAG: phosphopantothenoylcysteine decarboxylase [Candidatus Omnitrophota bacterium]